MSTLPNLGTERRLTRLETDSEYRATREDIARLETRMAELESRLLKWAIGVIIASIVAASAITNVVSRLGS